MSREQEQNAIVSAEPRALVHVPRTKGYWEKVAGAYSLIFRVLLIALPLYVVVFMAICARAFTYESVFCFFKDLKATTSFVTSDYQSVLYTYEEGESLVLPYRGGVAAVSENGIEIFSPDGERLLGVEEGRTSPRAVASRKYLISYDFGKSSFTVTNTYAKLHTGDTGFPIYAAEVSNTGHFAFVTAARDHLSQVLLYDGNFNLVQRFQKASAVTGVALSENGKYIALLALTSEGGRERTVLELYRIGTAAPIATVALEEEQPVRVDFTNDRHIALLTDTALRVLDLDGDVKGEVRYTGVPVAFDSSEDGCALVLRTDAMQANNRVVLLDKKGKVCYDAMHQGDVTSLSVASERAFLLMGEEIVAISAEDGGVSAYACETGATRMFAIDDEHVRVVYDGEARLYLMD